jgi:putative ABC transport system permease protein
VIGAFFTVWTMQRRGDIAILKALGATNAALVRDALGQALVVLVAGTLVGSAIVIAAGIAIAGSLPFLMSPWTTLAPAVVLIVVGLVGAAFALRTVTTSDPLTALGSNR